jgi:hypothetical protein
MSDDLRSIKEKYVTQSQQHYKSKEEWVNAVAYEKYIKKAERSFMYGNKEAIFKYLDEYARFVFKEMGNNPVYREKVKRTFEYYNTPMPEYM